MWPDWMYLWGAYAHEDPSASSLTARVPRATWIALRRAFFLLVLPVVVAVVVWLIQGSPQQERPEREKRRGKARAEAVVDGTWARDFLTRSRD